MGPSSGPREIRLSTTPDKSDLDALELGDIVYLDGLIYTAREGVYMRALDEGAPLPIDLPAASAATPAFGGVVTSGFSSNNKVSLPARPFRAVLNARTPSGPMRFPLKSMSVKGFASINDARRAQPRSATRQCATVSSRSDVDAASSVATCDAPTLPNDAASMRSSSSSGLARRWAVNVSLGPSKHARTTDLGPSRANGPDGVAGASASKDSSYLGVAALFSNSSSP